ncbi:MAG: hypothetical protein ACREQ5_14060, partial [Candidatus Dormibacteria bacterium]
RELRKEKAETLGPGVRRDDASAHGIAAARAVPTPQGFSGNSMPATETGRRPDALARPASPAKNGNP